jgi:hypothetical protein
MNATDYTVSADVTPLSSAVADRDNVVIARGIDRQNYYYAGIASWGNKYAIDLAHTAGELRRTPDDDGNGTGRVRLRDDYSSGRCRALCVICDAPVKNLCDSRQPRGPVRRGLLEP